MLIRPWTTNYWAQRPSKKKAEPTILAPAPPAVPSVDNLISRISRLHTHATLLAVKPDIDLTSPRFINQLPRDARLVESFKKPQQVSKHRYPANVPKRIIPHPAYKERITPLELYDQNEKVLAENPWVQGVFDHVITHVHEWDVDLVQLQDDYDNEKRTQEDGLARAWRQREQRVVNDPRLPRITRERFDLRDVGIPEASVFRKVTGGPCVRRCSTNSTFLVTTPTTL